jgi:hypothetical protein
MMNVKIVDSGGARVAVCVSDGVVIHDGQSALDFVMDIAYGHGCNSIAIDKAAISEDFFKLSTGIAGEVAQKFANYRFRVAVIGDFSGYTSEPLRDYMYECNNGKHLYFVPDYNTAIAKLSG